MLITYNFPLPPKDCPSREPGGYCAVQHYVTDASLASRGRELHLNLDTIGTACEEANVDNTESLNNKQYTDNANAVSNECDVCK